MNSLTIQICCVFAKVPGKVEFPWVLQNNGSYNCKEVFNIFAYCTLSEQSLISILLHDSKKTSNIAKRIIIENVC